MCLFPLQPSRILCSAKFLSRPRPEDLFPLLCWKKDASKCCCWMCSLMRKCVGSARVSKDAASPLALVLEPLKRQCSCANGPHQGRAAAEENRPEVTKRCLTLDSCLSVSGPCALPSFVCPCQCCPQRGPCSELQSPPPRPSVFSSSAVHPPRMSLP